jgi:hypothetical protein
MSFVRRGIAAVVLSVVVASQALAQATTISIGTVGSGNTLEWPLYIAEKKGFLEHEKLALEWVGTQSSAAVMQQVAAGSPKGLSRDCDPRLICYKGFSARGQTVTRALQNLMPRFASVAVHLSRISRRARSGEPSILERCEETCPVVALKSS